MNVYEKLLEVQKKLNAPKSKYNDFGKYHYRSCEDILEGVKPLLDKVKATIVLSDDIVQIAERIYVRATAQFIDIEKEGQIVENTAYAREPLVVKGMSDSQVTGSASTYARKSALNGLLCIDDSIDEDSSNVSDEERKQLEEEKKKADKEASDKHKADKQDLIKQEKDAQKTDAIKNQEMIDSTDPDLVPHGEGMTPARVERIRKELKRTGNDEVVIKGFYKVNDLTELTENQYISVINQLSKKPDKEG